MITQQRRPPHLRQPPHDFVSLLVCVVLVDNVQRWRFFKLLPDRFSNDICYYSRQNRENSQPLAESPCNIWLRLSTAHNTAERKESGSMEMEIIAVSLS